MIRPTCAAAVLLAGSRGDSFPLRPARSSLMSLSVEGHARVAFLTFRPMAPTLIAIGEYDTA